VAVVAAGFRQPVMEALAEVVTAVLEPLDQLEITTRVLVAVAVAETAIFPALAHVVVPD
jgi:P2-related tail formation protein